MTPKQKRFCDEYMVDFNGTQAAIRAGYSTNTANMQASRLLSKDNIKKYVNVRQKALAEKTGITAERVINEIAKIAFANMRLYVDKGNVPKDIGDLPDDIAAAVQEVTREEKEFKGVKTVTKKIKLNPKLDALRDLGKHLGLFTDKIEIDGKILSMEHVSVDILQKIIKSDGNSQIEDAEIIDN